MRREFGTRLAFVPEAATLLFAGGFPGPTEQFGKEGINALQKAIYGVQIALEDVLQAQYPDRILLCDRYAPTKVPPGLICSGTCDGAAYWPDGVESFFKENGTTSEEVRPCFLGS